ncbi:MAG: hypothetical protein II309_04185, partial [Bacilli bacterium]|nr:hypothetical protein [Bacilli bacterium]
ANNIEILEEYKGNKIKIKCKCKIDGYEWTSTPNSLLGKNSGCPQCRAKKISEISGLTHNEFLEKFYKKNSNANNIEILEEYKGNKIKIKCKCKIDGYEWTPVPHNLLTGQGCPMCYGNIKKTHEQFIKELEEINSNIEVLEEYKGASTKIKCRCKIDNHIWKVKPNSLLNMKSGCPKCNSSKGEKRIVNYLDKYNIVYIYNKSYFNNLFSMNNKLLRPDFILPQYKIWIEFDGIQHFEPQDFANRGKDWAEENFKQTQVNDKIKDEYAKDNDWNLIRIPYWELDNIEKILDEILN